MINFCRKQELSYFSISLHSIENFSRISCNFFLTHIERKLVFFSHLLYVRATIREVFRNWINIVKYKLSLLMEESCKKGKVRVNWDIHDAWKESFCGLHTRICKELFHWDFEWLGAFQISGAFKLLKRSFQNAHRKSRKLISSKTTEKILN